MPTCHDPAADVSQLISRLAALIQDAAGGARLEAVGIGASGPVDRGGVIRNDATLPGYSHIPLAQLITARLGVPCAIDNDAVAAALGENTYGAGQHSPVLLAITLGTGIGVALLHDGTPYRGSDGVHPEAGHIPVPGPPAPCYCGLATCWEQLASRSALDTATGQATDQMAAAAIAGDQRSRQIFDRYAEHVATGLATLTTAFRPARVVVGGSAARYLPLLRPGIDRALTRVPALRLATPGGGRRARRVLRRDRRRRPPGYGRPMRTGSSGHARGIAAPGPREVLGSLLDGAEHLAFHHP